ncbi:hypothetical protein DL96DRAFT_1573039 [Flagelloscypha sp. PMI_526]|nr:hypothetical protein DL96DRAFT_1573039 [Flagelloscypha sp. PMI_526]
MPKAQQSQRPNGSGHSIALKRNQACHQCRRRKLKCDAQRPCSTCLRSHNHAVTHAAPGVTLPREPECTYDENAQDQPPSATEQSKARSFEPRINGLEPLSEKGGPDGGPNSAPVTPSLHVPGSSMPFGNSQSPPSHVTSITPYGRPTGTPTSANGDTNGFHLGGETAVSGYGWPVSLPTPELLRHLVEAFFTFHPHARRLFHTSTFMSSLVLPYGHANFPADSVLHAICAIGSFYTAAVTSPPLPNLDEVAADELFSLRHRQYEDRPDSFAEQQAQFAKDCADRGEMLGENMFQHFQARLILSWFYWAHSKWVEVFVASSTSLRMATPMGLNVCPPFHSITKTWRPSTTLPAARTVIEDEVRRSSFWLAYATEREHGSGNGWAMCLDDEDISQLMPTRTDQFEGGVLVPPQERQWAHTPNLLLTHADAHTDPFVLYIKGTIILSRVKCFNLRFRAKHYAGDLSVTAPATEGETLLPSMDPRGSPAFMELDHIASNFRSSFPAALRTPIIQDALVDNHLYTACLMPLAATIILHDPHANIERSGCISALKILTAARSILELIYEVFSTSFDISLLDPFCAFCWFLSGRVLLRFLQAAIATNNQEQMETLRSELEFVHSAIVKLGRRIPLAFRYARMLHDQTISACGPQYAMTAMPSNHLAMGHRQLSMQGGNPGHQDQGHPFVTGPPPNPNGLSLPNQSQHYGGGSPRMMTPFMS